MASDFKSKQLTKNEKVMYNILVSMREMEHRVWSLSNLAVSLAMLAGADPAKLAELIAGDKAKIDEYTGKLNQAISERQKDSRTQDELVETMSESSDFDKN